MDTLNMEQIQSAFVLIHNKCGKLLNGNVWNIKVLIFKNNNVLLYFMLSTFNNYDTLAVVLPLLKISSNKLIFYTY